MRRDRMVGVFWRGRERFLFIFFGTGERETTLLFRMGKTVFTFLSSFYISLKFLHFSQVFTFLSSFYTTSPSRKHLISISTISKIHLISISPYINYIPKKKEWHAIKDEQIKKGEASILGSFMKAGENKSRGFWKEHKVTIVIVVCVIALIILCCIVSYVKSCVDCIKCILCPCC